MRCEEYLQGVQAQLDGEQPDAATETDMRAHEQTCAACRAMGENLRRVHAQCRTLDDELETPDAFARGWRQAVRAEAKKKKRLSPRVLAGVAAALVIAAVGGQALLNPEKPDARLHTQSNDMMRMAQSMPEMESMAPSMTGMTMAAAKDSGAGETETMGEKRIRTASIRLRTGDFDAVLDALRTMPGQFGGYIGDEDVYGVAGEDARNASLRVHVESDRLDDFLAQAQALGEVRSRSVNTQDVTSAYMDVSGRLDSARARRDRLNELVAQASGMADLIELEAALSEVQLSIEEYERTLSGWDARVAYAEVHVSVQETLVVEATRAGDLGLAARIGGALRDSVEALDEFAQNTLVALIAALPWLAVLGVLGGVAWGIFRRGKKKSSKH